MIAVIDYRAGNSPSVLNALTKLGVPAKLANTAEEIERADGIILPGVGSADATMQSLRELGLISDGGGLLYELVLEKKVPFLGICVGEQVLFEHSEEGDVNCLGWLRGEVKRFDGSDVRVPQMGWNKVVFAREGRLNRDVRESYLYFVNSYRAVPADASDTLGTADYGGDFCAVVERGNIFGAQCHLEKSGRAGLEFLQNFALICEK